jgi:hypothetical protein
VLATQRLTAESKGLQLHLDYPATTNEFFCGDPLRLQQVLTNLLGNAVKFTLHGEVRLKVTGEPGAMRLAVKDTGIGIAADRLEKIFEPFAQADAARARELLAGLVPAEAVSSRETPGSVNWWVAMPPQKSRAEAQRKLAELKALGVTGYTLLETADEWQYSIELGTFAEEALAREYLAKLQQVGVRTAQVVERRAPASVQWLVREPGEALMVRVLALKQEHFPDSALGAIECPPVAAPAR